MNELVLGIVEILLKKATDEKLFKYLEEYVLILWEKDIPNSDKKKLVIEKAGAIWTKVGPVIISFLIKFIVTGIRLRMANDPLSPDAPTTDKRVV